MGVVTDTRSGISFGWTEGADNWGGLLNGVLRRLAYAGPNLTVLDQVSAPPTIPMVGDKYLVGASPTGAWSTWNEHDIAVWGYGEDGDSNPLAWQRFIPLQGQLAYHADEEITYVYDGTSWIEALGATPAPPAPPPAPVGITSVSTDDTIDGDGTLGDPLSFNASEGQVQSDWDSGDANSPAFIQNKPIIHSPVWRQDTGFIGGILNAGVKKTEKIVDFRLNSVGARIPGVSRKDPSTNDPPTTNYGAVISVVPYGITSGNDAMNGETVPDLQVHYILSTRGRTGNAVTEVRRIGPFDNSAASGMSIRDPNFISSERDNPWSTRGREFYNNFVISAELSSSTGGHYSILFRVVGGPRLDAGGD